MIDAAVFVLGWFTLIAVIVIAVFIAILLIAWYLDEWVKRKALEAMKEHE